LCLENELEALKKVSVEQDELLAKNKVELEVIVITIITIVIIVIIIISVFTVSI